MTDNLKEDELLDWIDTWIKNCLKTCIEINCIEGIEQCRQACKQIKERVQAYEEHQELTANYIDIVIDLYDQLEKKKPQVTEEFVKKWADVIHQADTGLFGISRNLARGAFGIKGELKLVRQMLKEAGVSVA